MDINNKSNHHEAMFNKICLNQNGDAKIYTPSGVFIISADTDKEYHGVFVSFKSYDVDYEQQIAYVQDVQNPRDEHHDKLKLVTWEDSKSDADQLVIINKTKEEDLWL